MKDCNVRKILQRDIPDKVERELWARAAGRCQFNGCNHILYKSPVTQENVNIAEQAHIYSFSENGPRGRDPFKEKWQDINDIENLILVCHGCHKTIDQDKNGIKYSALLLRQWKKEHEHRIYTVTNIAPDRKSYVVFYGGNIGEQRSILHPKEAMEAMFPNRYPISDNPIVLSMSWSEEDKSSIFWSTEITNLKREFDKKISSLIENDQNCHFSLFCLAPTPLLMLLGTLFTDKFSVDTYQPIREPKGWHWQTLPKGFEFIIKKPKERGHSPVLVISLSDIINHERVKMVMGEKVSIWELTVPREHIHNDNIRNKMQLYMIRDKIRNIMVQIKAEHGSTTPLSVFPAMAVSCAVEMGRVRMPKADMPWVIYDQNNKKKKFIKTITIK